MSDLILEAVLLGAEVEDNFTTLTKNRLLQKLLSFNCDMKYQNSCDAYADIKQKGR